MPVMTMRRLAMAFPALAVHAALSMLCPDPARAQSLPQGVLTNPVPQGSPIPRMLPPTPPAVSTQGLEAPANQPGALVSGPPVPVTDVAVTGVTVYSQQDIATLVQGLPGPA